MGKAIAEKIMSIHSGCDVNAGDIAICDVQFILAGHEANATLTIDSFQRLCRSKGDTVFDPSRVLYCLDHVVPSQNENYSCIQQMVKEYAIKHKIIFRDVGYGICHQIIPEDRLVYPGEIVVGADSHTCTYGALNVFSTGMGSTDIAVAMKTGKQWFKVPHSSRVVIDGTMPKGVYSKDIILYLLGKYKSNRFNYQCIEFTGEAISALSVEQRLTISNMAVELGAKAGIMEYDEKVEKWYGKYTNRAFKPVYADQTAQYRDVIRIDAKDIVPQVAHSHSLEHVSAVRDLEVTKISQAILGTCTNGRLEDLEAAATILKGKVISKDVRMIVYPASAKVLLEATRCGITQTLMEAGAMICPSGCGPCAGLYGGVPWNGETVVASSNRNFRGRMGNRNANILIASPATVAASAVTGYLTDPTTI